MHEIDYDDVDYSETYKKYIRGSEYDEVVTKTVNETAIFIKGNKKTTVTFTLQFSFSFENGFYYTNFSNFIIQNEEEDKQKYIDHIKDYYVNSDRLSC